MNARPLIRNRNRTERLFGFFYRIEIFIPEPKREYGYTSFRSWNPTA